MSDPAGSGGAEPLASTKLVPPRLPRGAVALARQRVLMDQVLAHSLCLVRAPSGYGKSTLCTHWHNAFAAAGYLTGWVSFDSDDDDAGRAINYLLQAIQRPLHNGETGVALAFDSLVPPQILATHCINAIFQQPRPFVLFLDDFDKLNDSRLLQFTNYILLHCPANLHIVVACQSQPALPLVYLDSHAALMRIGADELRLREAEACELLAATGTPLRRQDVVRLNDAMAGWVTGLRIGSAALRNNRDALDEIGLVAQGANWLSDYLDENIFQHLAPAARHFLTHCSIIETLTVELCQLLSGDAAAGRTLRWLADQNLFIQCLDEASSLFRIHPVFREFLASKLRQDNPDLPRRLHALASRWYAQNEHLPEAVRHALDAGETGRAAALLSVDGMAMVERSDVLGLLKWVSRIPRSEVKRYFWLQLAEAWALMLCLRPQARQLIDDLRAEAEAATDPLERGRRLRELAGLETVFLLVYEDRIEASLALGTAFLAEPVDEGSFTARAVRNAVAYCEIGRGGYQRAAATLRPAQLQAMRSEQLFPTAYRHTVIGLGYRQQGQLAEAERTFRAGVALAERKAGRDSPSAVLVAAFLARSLYERDAVDEARDVLAGRLPVIDEACYHEAVIDTYVVAVRAAALAGDRVEAARLIDHAELLGHERRWSRLLAQCAAERARLGLLQSMDLDAILPVDREAAAISAPLGEDARNFALLAEPRLRLALAAGDEGRARQVSTRLALLAERMDSFGLRLTSALLALSAAGPDAGAPTTVIAQALGLGFGRTIVDMLDEDRLRNLVEADHPPDRRYLFRRLRGSARLAPGSTASAPPPKLLSGSLFSVLTSREIDVLTGVSCGHSNKEIARQIHLTPETVKWHLKNIMRKMGVDSRSAAVERGIQLGLATTAS